MQLTSRATTLGRVAGGDGDEDAMSSSRGTTSQSLFEQQEQQSSSRRRRRRQVNSTSSQYDSPFSWSTAARKQHHENKRKSRSFAEEREGGVVQYALTLALWSVSRLRWMILSNDGLALGFFFLAVLGSFFMTCVLHSLVVSFNEGEDYGTDDTLFLRSAHSAGFRPVVQGLGVLLEPGGPRRRPTSLKRYCDPDKFGKSCESSSIPLMIPSLASKVAYTAARGRLLLEEESFTPRTNLTTFREEYQHEPDYGGLKVGSNSVPSSSEYDSPDTESGEGSTPKKKHKKRKHHKPSSNSYRSGYYAFDDDVVRADYIREGSSCKRTALHPLYHPSCNTFHEFVELDPTLYISHGYFREVWSVVHGGDDELVPEEEIVLKKGRYKYNFQYDHYEYTRMDALVMERLTSSPRITDMYGHCGLSVLTERLDVDLEGWIIPGSGHLKTHKLNDKDDVDPQNAEYYTPTQKLEMALGMAESIADLHGFADGVIVHDDVQLCQFFLTAEGKVKLNDFNRAEVMLYDTDRKEYCRYRNGPGRGNYRSPEEFMDNPINEKIDTFSLGNNFYALLTGLWIFYGTEDDEVVQKWVIKGERPFIDERYRTHSYAERALVYIMEECWTYEPDERPDIFAVVDFLRKAVAENQRRLDAGDESVKLL